MAEQERCCRLDGQQRTAAGQCVCKCGMYSTLTGRAPPRLRCARATPCCAAAASPSWTAAQQAPAARWTCPRRDDLPPCRRLLKQRLPARQQRRARQPEAAQPPAPTCAPQQARQSGAPTAAPACCSAHAPQSASPAHPPPSPRLSQSQSRCRHRRRLACRRRLRARLVPMRHGGAWRLRVTWHSPRGGRPRARASARRGLLVRQLYRRLRSTTRSAAQSTAPTRAEQRRWRRLAARAKRNGSGSEKRRRAAAKRRGEAKRRARAARPGATAPAAAARACASGPARQSRRPLQVTWQRQRAATTPLKRRAAAGQQPGCRTTRRRTVLRTACRVRCHPCHRLRHATSQAHHLPPAAAAALSGARHRPGTQLPTRRRQPRSPAPPPPPPHAWRRLLPR